MCLEGAGALQEFAAGALWRRALDWEQCVLSVGELLPLLHTGPPPGGGEGGVPPSPPPPPPPLTPSARTCECAAGLLLLALAANEPGAQARLARPEALPRLAHTLGAGTDAARGYASSIVLLLNASSAGAAAVSAYGGGALLGEARATLDALDHEETAE